MHQVYIHNIEGVEWATPFIAKLEIAHYFMQAVKPESTSDEALEIVDNNKGFYDICDIHLFVIDGTIKGIDFAIVQHQIMKAILHPTKKVVLHVILKDIKDWEKWLVRRLVYLVREQGGIGIIDDNIEAVAAVLNTCYKV